jgi:predicted AAA+ superfamily ATPase
MNIVYDNDLKYYQTSSGGEIDFILNDEIPLEVKSTPNRRNLNNLMKRVDAAGLNRNDAYLVSDSATEVDRTVMTWDL